MPLSALDQIKLNVSGRFPASREVVWNFITIYSCRQARKLKSDSVYNKARIQMGTKIKRLVSFDFKFKSNGNKMLHPNSGTQLVPGGTPDLEPILPGQLSCQRNTN